MMKTKDDIDFEGVWVANKMTLRQWYAGQALAGMLSGERFRMENMVTEAFQFADAMIEAEAKDADS
jgi:hypothetical protein